MRVKITYKGENSELAKELKRTKGNEDVTLPENLLEKEDEVVEFLTKIRQNPQDYGISVFQRKALTAYPGKKIKYASHRLYAIENRKTDEVYILSFNGTKLSLYSEGAWGLNTNTDIKSMDSYYNGNNKYDMSVCLGSKSIDVDRTAESIINSINSSKSYYALDHIVNKINMENCNTALWSTLRLN
jgi:hypothetical protein